jgi:hypothetical protein
MTANAVITDIGTDLVRKLVKDQLRLLPRCCNHMLPSHSCFELRLISDWFLWQVRRMNSRDDAFVRAVGKRTDRVAFDGDVMNL